ncbi:MAG: MBL fold metallo-hydrolase [Clostridia bacterium]|nr:MBL fold metallo-hydrolase [Clostridia bacterium]
MKVYALYGGGVAAVCYLAVSDDEKEGVLIDPAVTPEVAAARLGTLPTLTAILLTHGHFDHMLALDAWRRKTGAPVYIHEADAEALSDPEKNASGVFFPMGECYGRADHLLREGDQITFGGEALTLMHTPGHTRGSSVFVGKGVLFTGDTLMADGNYGRYDLYGGSATALRDSLRRILALGGDYRIYPGHGGDTTKEEEKKYYTSII